METPPVFPLLYFGPVTYFGELLAHGTVRFDRHEHFPKQTLRSRCVIMGANGPLTLSIPVKRQGEKVPLESAIISNAERWQHLHWRSFESAYRSSPFFDYYADELEPFFTKPVENLFTFNTELLQMCLRWLQADLSWSVTEAFEREAVGSVEYRTWFEQHPHPTNLPTYYQVFESKHPFAPNLSILDLLFNLGPGGREYLMNLPRIG